MSQSFRIDQEEIYPYNLLLRLTGRQVVRTETVIIKGIIINKGIIPFFVQILTTTDKKETVLHGNHPYHIILIYHNYYPQI